FVCCGAVTDDDVSSAAKLLSGLGDVRGVHVAMYPGGAHAFGLVEGKPFFGLPTTTVSAFVAFEALVRPAVLRMMGRRDQHRPEVTAVLDEALAGPAGITLMVPARVSRREGVWHAAPTGQPGPDLLAGVVRANGIVVVPPGTGRVEAGARVRAQVLRSPGG
ncbi:MAG: molybdopterin molybdenumtransferase MoeA, partial [Actinomycetota bacterium]|nr:molybdopterin molybdenumtransferase MoeA [Actinomycetota bacterium]